MGFVVLTSSVAGANGRTPGAQYVVVGPGATSQEIVVRTTFGVLVSVDGGTSFHFLCENALGFLDGFDPAVELGAQAGLLVGDPDGMDTTLDNCTMNRVPVLEGNLVSDLAADPSSNIILAAVVSRDVVPRSYVARSTLGGLDFQRPMDVVNGVPDAGLPGVRLTNVDVGSLDGMTLYASGVDDTGTGTAGTPRFYVSTDGGQTLRGTSARFPGASGVFLSGVDPTHPATVYVRTSATGTPSLDGGTALGTTQLFRSDDGGESFRVVGQTVGTMRGFAISGDGQHVYIGSPDATHDGLMVSDGGGPFHTLAHIPVECLRWHPTGLYVCETFGATPNLLQRTTDGGMSFETLLRFDTVMGPPVCPSTSPVALLCPAAWEGVHPRIAPASVTDGGFNFPDVPGHVQAPTTSSCGCDVRGEGNSGGMWTWALTVALGLWDRRTRQSDCKPGAG